jgi:hypothetical protein
MNRNYLSRLSLGAVLAVGLLRAPAWAGTFTPRMSGGSGVPPGVAAHGTGYLSISLEQGETSAFVTLLTVNPTNGVISIKSGGGRLKGANNVNPVFTQTMPVVVAKDQQNCYVLATSGVTYPDALYAYQFTNGVQETNQYGAAVPRKLDLSIFPGGATFGACALPDGRGMIVTSAARDSSGIYQADVAYFEWGAGADGTLTKVAETMIPIGPSGYFRPNISCTVTHNFDAAARWYPYRLTLGYVNISGAAVVRDYRLNTKMSADLLDRYFVTPIPGEDGWTTLTTGAQNVGVSMHTGMDGRAYVAVERAPTIEMFARTGFDANQKAVWENTEHLSKTNYESLPIFVYKPVYDAAHPNDPIPVNRVGFYTSTTGSGARGYDDAFGLARRRDFPQSSVSSAGAVVGIVEGPPPIPDENLKLFGPGAVHSEFNFAYDSTSQKSTTATLGQGLSMGASATLGGEVQGFGASVEIEKEVTDKFESSYSEQTGSHSEQFLGVSSGTFPSDDGTYQVTKRLGTLFVATMSFGGAIYEFGTMQGGQFVPTPGSLTFTQLWPKGAYNIEPRGWWMNPNGRIPGDIPSYEAAPGETDALNAASKINFTGLTGSANYIYFSMEDDSSVHTAYDYFSGLSQSEASTVSTHEALKVSATTPIGGGSVSGAQDTETTRSWDAGTDSHVGVSVISQIQNDRRASAPPNYYSLNYQTYLLKDDNAYLRELLSDDPNGIGMVTSVWPPPGSPERKQNEELKAALIRSSKPWKVTYVVTRAIKNVPLNPAAYGPTPEAALLQTLQRYGLNSTAGVDSLIQAKEGHRTGRVGNATQFQSALAAVGSGDIAVLHKILAEAQAAQMAAWRQAHPVRYTFEDTLKEMAKPDWGRKGPLFTTAPPEGL